MRNEMVNGHPIRCYDNGGKTIDRYTVVYMDDDEGRRYEDRRYYGAVAMDAQPFHPLGFGQHTSAVPGYHLGKRIAFTDLPEDCQKVVKQDLVVDKL